MNKNLSLEYTVLLHHSCHKLNMLKESWAKMCSSLVPFEIVHSEGPFGDRFLPFVTLLSLGGLQTLLSWMGNKKRFRCLGQSKIACTIEKGFERDFTLQVSKISKGQDTPSQYLAVGQRWAMGEGLYSQLVQYVLHVDHDSYCKEFGQFSMQNHCRPSMKASALICS